jgi:hypothetical protein
MTAKLATGSWSPAFCFSIKGAFLAGKILDRNISPTKPSVAQAMDLDEQVTAVATSMTEDWWRLPVEPRRLDIDLNDLRERLLLQFYFFHIKIYIHLPFIGSSSGAVSCDVSRLKCMEAARELLKRFNLLRAEAQGSCLFECKTADFIGFTTTIVLLIGLSQSPDLIRGKYSDIDENLIAATESIFERDEARGCKIASQFRRTLRFLSSRGSNTEFEADFREQSGIRIPFFGTVVRRHLGIMPAHSLATRGDGGSGGSSFVIPTPTDSGTAINPAVQSLSIDQFNIEHQGPGTMALALDGPHWDVESTAGVFGDFSSWLDPAMMDLDQDWTTLPATPTF